MIARLTGKVIELENDVVVIDCGGVGYGVYICHDERQNLRLGEVCELYVAEQIKEDLHDLFGFSAASRKQLFSLLVSVNGVGPKAAMAILNIGTEAQVRSAIASGDTKFITAAKGVGKKVAERAVVDLKNKVGLESSSDSTSFLSDLPASDEAVEALTALGHSVIDATRMLQGIDTDIDTAERVRQALRGNK